MCPFQFVYSSYVKHENSEVLDMGFVRNEGGEHATFLIRLLLLLMQKTPDGGATIDDIRGIYADVKKSGPPSDKSIQRAIHKLNYIFDPSSADEDLQFRTPHERLPVRTVISMQGGKRVRRFTFQGLLTPERETDVDKTAKLMLHLYPQQRQMQTEDFEKMFELLAASIGKQSNDGGRMRDDIERFVFVSGFSPTESRQNLQRMLQIFQAFRRQKKVRFQYTSASTGEKSAMREVSSYGLVSRHGVWYLVGHCHSANAMRIFRIDHIARITIVENSIYTIPTGYSLSRTYGALWGIWTESEKPAVTERVELHVAAAISSHFDTIRYHASQEVRKNTDGSLKAVFTVGGAREMLPWLLGWGACVKVLEPEWLRDEVVNSAKKLLEQYA